MSELFTFKSVTLPRSEWEKRLWAKVTKSDGCWEWVGTRNQKGYGTFVIRINGKQIRFIVHRLSYALAIGKDPGPLMVCHVVCDNPSCCRPDHLKLGDAKLNNNDAFRKGRNKVVGHYARENVGEKNPTSRYTWPEVHEMRRLSELGWSDTQLAEKFGGSRGGVWAITNYVNWPESESA
jgi:hypothetical protein